MGKRETEKKTVPAKSAEKPEFFVEKNEKKPGLLVVNL